MVGVCLIPCQAQWLHNALPGRTPGWSTHKVMEEIYARPVSLQTPSCQLLASGDRVCLSTWKAATATHMPICAHTDTNTAHRHICIMLKCILTPTSAHTHTRTHKVFHFEIDSRINLKLSSPSFIIQFQPIYIHVPCQSNFSTLNFDIFGNTEHEYSCC